MPVGLSRYREGLYPLEPFEKEDAEEVIDLIEKYQRECFEKYGIHFIQASDEWYILAGREMPEEERYDGYLQLENGVRMIRLLKMNLRRQSVSECWRSRRLLRRGQGTMRRKWRLPQAGLHTRIFRKWLRK